MIGVCFARDRDKGWHDAMGWGDNQCTCPALQQPTQESFSLVVVVVVVRGGEPSWGEVAVPRLSFDAFVSSRTEHSTVRSLHPEIRCVVGIFIWMGGCCQ